jgi:hypothetical protein
LIRRVNFIIDRLLALQSLDLRYATKLSEGSASGRSYNGKIIDSDDLGRAIFGYTDNQQSRLEARNVNGEVRGDVLLCHFEIQLTLRLKTCRTIPVSGSVGK